MLFLSKEGEIMAERKTALEQYLFTKKTLYELGPEMSDEELKDFIGVIDRKISENKRELRHNTKVVALDIASITAEFLAGIGLFSSLFADGMVKNVIFGISLSMFAVGAIGHLVLKEKYDKVDDVSKELIKLKEYYQSIIDEREEFRDIFPDLA